METKNKAKTCYSDAELTEFKTLILSKIKEAQELLEELMNSLIPHESSEKFAEAAATNHERETTTQLAARQKKLIDQLKAALDRIENKTYGICTEKGTLIPAGRLRAVPHTTKCMEAKVKGNFSRAA